VAQAALNCERPRAMAMAMAARQQEGALAAFCLHWGLNADAEGKLRGLVPEAAEAVMREFMPPSEIAEVSGKFIMFAASVEKRVKGVGKGSFGKGKGVRATAGWEGPILPVQAAAWQSFSDGGFRRGATSAGWTPGKPRQSPAGPMINAPVRAVATTATASTMTVRAGESSADVPDPDAEQNIQAFTHAWAVNGDAVDKLRRLSPAALSTVLREFQPQGQPMLGIGSDWSGKLISFATRVEQTLRADPIAAFLGRWALNDDAKVKMSQLTPEQLEIVLREFRPRSPVTDCNGQLIMFACSIQKRFATPTWPSQHLAAPLQSQPGLQSHGNVWQPDPAQFKRPPEQQWADEGPPLKFAYVDGKGKCRGTPASTVHGASADAPVLGAKERIAELAMTWPMNQDATDKLLRLSPASLETVLRDFNPQGDTSGFGDWSGKLISFAAQIERTFRADPVAAFAGRWNLNDDARVKLAQLSPAALERVLCEFLPPQDGTADCNGKLIMFAHSVQKRLDGGNPAAMSWGR